MDLSRRDERAPIRQLRVKETRQLLTPTPPMQGLQIEHWRHQIDSETRFENFRVMHIALSSLLSGLANVRHSAYTSTLSIHYTNSRSVTVLIN